MVTLTFTPDEADLLKSIVDNEICGMSDWRGSENFDQAEYDMAKGILAKFS